MVAHAQTPEQWTGSRLTNTRAPAWQDILEIFVELTLTNVPPLLVFMVQHALKVWMSISVPALLVMQMYLPAPACQSSMNAHLHRASTLALASTMRSHTVACAQMASAATTVKATLTSVTRHHV